ncbi:MAG: histidine kinase [Mariniblastus sp.]
MTIQKSSNWEIFKLQSLVTFVLLVLLLIILAVWYLQDCKREWSLREEQTTHRLELAFEIVSRDLERVRADVLYIANQKAVRAFNNLDPENRRDVEREFSNLLNLKQNFQQVRLIDRQGLEVARVELVGNKSFIVSSDQFQDKSDRYYFRDSLELSAGEVFVSEFDLNQERGEIEQPLNPVIRFVTPVTSDDGTSHFLLVANYRGAPLLNELSSISLPGETLLVRIDGQYLLATKTSKPWGWLLGHKDSFISDFPRSWNREIRKSKTAESGIPNSDTRQSNLHFDQKEGAFAFRPLKLRRGKEKVGSSETRTANAATNETKLRDLFLVSRIPPESIYENSRQLLWRLLLFSTAIFVPLLLLTRLWAVGSVRRKMQNNLIKQSEIRLRELSSRLVRIQEDERRAISREIHDQLGQQVTAINLDIKLLKQKLNPIDEDTERQLDRSISVSENLLSELHDFASRVRPVELDDLGLHDAVESHLQEFQQRTGVGFSFDCKLGDIEVSDVIAENVFRLVQESLNNVLKHANATMVEVSIQTTKIGEHNNLIVKVHDNGVGTRTISGASSPDSKFIEGSPRLGILGMRERVELLGGTLDLDFSLDQGTRVTATVHLDTEFESSHTIKKETR